MNACGDCAVCSARQTQLKNVSGYLAGNLGDGSVVLSGYPCTPDAEVQLQASLLLPFLPTVVV